MEGNNDKEINDAYYILNNNRTIGDKKVKRVKVKRKTNSLPKKKKRR